MKEACEREVRELHLFFQEWYNGVLPKSEEAFARCARVLQPEFVMISPAGTAVSVEPLLQRLWEMHGTRTEPECFRIWTRPVRFLALSAVLGVLMYEEWQADNAGTTARLSSAVFHRNEELPCGVGWLHLHETWLPA